MLKKPRLRAVQVLLILLLTFAIASLAQADSGPSRTERPLPASIEQLALDQPLTVDNFELNKIDPTLIEAAGDQQVIIRLQAPSVSEQSLRGRAARNAQDAILGEQADLLGRVLTADPDAKIIAQTQIVLNAVFVEVNATALQDLALDPDVLRIVPVADYELDLKETVPYIGGTAVQAEGFDGTGVRVAVLDSGVDYTHANLGGGGTLADYEAAWGTFVGDLTQTTTDGLFPTAKVVGGYDFVGELWTPGGTLLPDPDPIDYEGHGTHVADIIGGVNGVAPGADIYAVKVCSAVSSSCSGIALIQGMEYAVDPNGDGDPSDAVDVINMSLGANYGQSFDDDLSLAVDNASAVGVLTVSSAGNGADKPYITGTPSNAVTALSVAQTQVPSAALQLITVDDTDYPAVFQPWSVPVSTAISAPVQYGDGAGGNLDGCAPFAPGSLTSLIVLVDRGACNFTLKIKYISDAGGAAGIIGLVAPGAPFSGGDGGDRPINIPGFMIDQADANAIKAAIAGGDGNGIIDPANQLPLVGQMVGSSSRGPGITGNLLKPEIGAPGASVSAIAGSGTGEGAFGGTSGASPMVAGSAALLLQAYPDLTPAEVKARLMNNGETDIDTDPFTGLAPITRIGGGEVRVDRALAAPAAAWDDDIPSGALSFGFVDVDDSTTVIQKTVRVRNYSNERIVYDVLPTFRYADDANSGALTVDAPRKVTVQPGKDATFTVKITIDGANLPDNFMNSGSEGANPSALTANEFDGYLILDDGEHPIHLAWHILPRQSSLVKGRSQLTFQDGIDTVSLNNIGLGTAQNDAYALIGLSPDQPEGARGAQSPTPDIRGVGVNTFQVPAGFCSAEPSFIWAFAINTWERQAHLLPVSHQIWLDTDQDGASDYVVLNRDASGLSTIGDGRQLAWALDLSTGGASAFFFAEHATNTGNTVLYICGEQVGLTGTDMLSTSVDAYVVTQDFYYGGPGDLVDGLTITPLGERYLGLPVDLPARSNGDMTVIDFGSFPGNSPEYGIMLFTNGDRGAGARGGATQDTEALFFTP